MPMAPLRSLTQQPDLARNAHCGPGQRRRPLTVVAQTYQTWILPGRVPAVVPFRTYMSNCLMMSCGVHSVLDNYYLSFGSRRARSPGRLRSPSSGLPSAQTSVMLMAECRDEMVEPGTSNSPNRTRPDFMYHAGPVLQLQHPARA